ncbi:MAG: type II secretion system F family protein [Nitrospirota bacterium]
MPFFEYKIAKENGTVIEDKLEAESEEALRSRLEGEGSLVFYIKKKGLSSFSLSSFRRSASSQDFLAFNQQFLALIKAGLPILASMDILVERVTDPTFQKALLSIKKDVKGGASLSDAMSKHPKIFPELYVASIRTGEQTGDLPEIIQRYITYLKKMLALRKKIKSAIAYPAFLITVSIIVVLFLLFYVMPTFSGIYAGYGKELPPATRILLSTVDFIKTKIYFLIAGIILLIILLKIAVRSERGRLISDKWILSLPVAGDIIIKDIIVRINRTLSTLLKGGIPLVTAMEIIAKAITNRVISSRLGEAIDIIKGGGTLSAAFEKTGIMPKMALKMIAVGEVSGSLEEMLNNISEIQEEEIDLKLTRLTTLIEPVIMIFMGIIVAFIVIAMYLPIFNLAGAVH